MSLIKRFIDGLNTPEKEVSASSDPKNLLKQSKVFCMAPWLQLHAQTDGNIGPCCMASMTDANALGNLNDEPNLGGAWNSEKMKQLRTNMMNGKQSSLCNNCYEYESNGRFSERQQYNRDWGHKFDRVDRTSSNGAVNSSDHVLIVDVRFSNLCNYKCRICSSQYSSRWNEDMQNGSESSNNRVINASKDRDRFWLFFSQLLIHIEQIHFAGGEPLIMEEHYRTLEHLIEVGNTDVTLTYNTNLSVLKYKNTSALSLWKQFKKVDVWASLDGMGVQGDYHRKGQDWLEIEKNLRAIKNECPNVNIGVNITASIFNILHIPEFYLYLVNNRLTEVNRVNVYHLTHPAPFAITNLTPSLKSQVRDRYESFIAKHQGLLRDTPFLNHIEATLSFMGSRQHHLMSAFKDKVESIDTIRKESFQDTFPELGEMLRPNESDNNRVKGLFDEIEKSFTSLENSSTLKLGEAQEMMAKLKYVCSKLPINQQESILSYFLPEDIHYELIVETLRQSNIDELQALITKHFAV